MSTYRKKRVRKSRLSGIKNDTAISRSVITMFDTFASKLNDHNKKWSGFKIYPLYEFVYDPRFKNFKDTFE